MRRADWIVNPTLNQSNVSHTFPNKQSLGEYRFRYGRAVTGERPEKSSSNLSHQRSINDEVQIEIHPSRFCAQFAAVEAKAADVVGQDKVTSELEVKPKN